MAQISVGANTSKQLTRVFALPALIGAKVIELEGETFTLENYFPALLTQDEWDTLQRIRQQRAQPRPVRKVVSILTGAGVSKCGYCNVGMKAQFQSGQCRPDGTLPDGFRRIHCMNTNLGRGCTIKGSCSSAPIERAIMAYCSDVMNLQALFGPDQSAAPRRELAAAQARLADIETKLERLTDVMLETSGPIPATFTVRARELEEQREVERLRVREGETAVTAATRINVVGADEQWAAIAAGVDAMNEDARTKARQLVIDTFDSITIWHHGIRPEKSAGAYIDVMLKAKGGVGRLLRIDKSAKWVVLDEAKSAEIAAV